ncbi:MULTISPECIES: hypothetical protein [Ensifer]|uniref:hypothetical protein n=1 Tax=Ensifer TaxID=106591 RepID=UPI000AA71BF0|nr:MULTISPECIES: hypothetical protein [Ensifer]MBD9491254.1 hypothetical protein [Ensifer sp. ENS11]MDP9634022.1 hypothetical protein [Ensifer adhaerens]NOV20644.1 hypothetical protein [Ensifer canadensis]
MAAATWAGSHWLRPVQAPPELRDRGRRTGEIDLDLPNVHPHGQFGAFLQISLIAALLAARRRANLSTAIAMIAA